MLTRYGISTWGPLTTALVVLGVLAAVFGWWPALIPLAMVWLAVAWFFRDPHRAIRADRPAGTMLSPADGRISAILYLEQHPAVDGPAVVIRTFLSVLNVHVNRSPCEGVVVDCNLTPGQFLDARTERSAEVNESNLIRLRIEGPTEHGETIGIRQVSGKVARRIVCGVAAGDQLAAGQRFGMIKFGSTAELILPRPDQVEVMVSVGDRVVGGRTTLARLDPEPAGARQGDRDLPQPLAVE